MSDDIVRVPDDEADGEEAWVRETDDPDVLGVEAVRLQDTDEWSWQVTVSVAEFIRDDPLEAELRREIVAALRSVPGVTDVAEEDREVWIVDGNPPGEALVRASAQVVDRLATLARKHIDTLS
jgi:hypothetical protein